MSMARLWCDQGKPGCRYSSRQPTTPNDHFTASPHCRVTGSGSGRVDRAGSCPTIRSGIVSPAGVQITTAKAAPQTIISLPVQTAV